MGDNSWMWVLAALLVFAGLAAPCCQHFPACRSSLRACCSRLGRRLVGRTGPADRAGRAHGNVVRDRFCRGGTRCKARRSDQIRNHRRRARYVDGNFLRAARLLVGPFAGAVTGELISHGRLPQAARAGMATWVGLLFGTLVKIALICTMIGISWPPGIASSHSR